MAETMDVVFVEGQYMTRGTVEHTLDAMRAEVGGWIETVPMGEGFVLVCNEEGMLLNLPQNLIGAYGRSFICRLDERTGSDLRGLTQDEQTYVMDRISQDLLSDGEY